MGTVSSVSSGSLLVKDREVVVPGQVLARGLDFVPSAGSYRDGDDVLASLLGIVEVNRFVERDEDLSKILSIGEYVVVGITNVTSQNLVDVTTRGQGLGPLRGGRIVSVGSSKVPRIIGKDGSMVKLLRDGSGCQINVGQNGWVWIDGSPESENKIVAGLREIESFAHLSGLTDHMQKFLEGLR